MDLATSQYAARDLILRSWRVPIGITVGNPRWPLGYVLACNLRALAPTRSMLGLPTDVFEQIYRARLDNLGVEAIRALLQRCCDDASNDRLVLLCFEDVDQPGKSCHRQMLATWWQEHTGDVVPELEPSCALSSNAAGSQDVRVGFGANTECWYRKLRRNLKSAHGSSARRCALRAPCECPGHFEKQPLPGNFGRRDPALCREAPETAGATGPTKTDCWRPAQPLATSRALAVPAAIR